MAPACEYEPRGHGTHGVAVLPSWSYWPASHGVQRPISANAPAEQPWHTPWPATLNCPAGQATHCTRVASGT